MALAEGGVATLMGASRRVAGLLGGVDGMGGTDEDDGGDVGRSAGGVDIRRAPQSPGAHPGSDDHLQQVARQHTASHQLPCPPGEVAGRAGTNSEQLSGRRKSVADAQVWMRATQFIILSPLGQRLGILAVAWRHSGSAPAGQPQRGSGGPVRLREQRGGLARGLGGGDMARADRGAGMNRLQAQGGNDGCSPGDGHDGSGDGGKEGFLKIAQRDFQEQRCTEESAGQGEDVADGGGEDEDEKVALGSCKGWKEKLIRLLTFALGQEVARLIIRQAQP
ncbi:hypothetical protein CYMTET_29946 [Cymbomonas tetramitiformis]|uniref:Uncharacterized protein n=1 Tax=Cymbomonas tetramitiformis TaxID=36881 RepID=A0AAE0FK21_9CHLO|nr:hypothetical protein CYMTET_29946 [Cymbomonas tetramitiformis]